MSINLRSLCIRGKCEFNCHWNRMRDFLISLCMSSSINRGQMLRARLFQDTSCLAVLVQLWPDAVPWPTHTQNCLIIRVALQQKHNCHIKPPLPNKGTARVDNVFDAQLMSHQRSRTVSYLILLTALSSAQVNTTQAAPSRRYTNFK